jgi:DNA-binding response OmpR family regulator
MTSAAMDRPATNRRLLLVDDDKALRQSLAEQLRLVESFDCREADTGKAPSTSREGAFRRRAPRYRLPDMDGREVCRLLRRAGVSAPIIMLTAADTDADTILGLDSGANDYITKPFRMGVLLARLRAPARQHAQSEMPSSPSGPIPSGPRPDAARPERQEEDPRLTEKETAILKFSTARARG